MEEQNYPENVEVDSIKDNFSNLIIRKNYKSFKQISESTKLINIETSLSIDELRIIISKVNSIANNSIIYMESMSENYEENINSEIEERTINPNSIINEIVRFYKPQINNKKLSVRIKLEENTEIKLAENNLEFIMRNIILNAFSYTNANGYVEISTKVIKDSFYFTVTDNGNGMKREEIQKIFESEELKNSSLRKCQEIIENLDGDLIIGSELGMGTKVTVSLPI